MPGWLLFIPKALRRAAAWALVALSALGATWLAASRHAAQRAKIRGLERRLKTIDEIKKDKSDAETQDDPTLIDRLTRR